MTSLVIADGMAVQQSQLGGPQRRLLNLAGLRYELEDLDTEYIERIICRARAMFRAAPGHSWDLPKA